MFEEDRTPHYCIYVFVLSWYIEGCLRQSRLSTTGLLQSPHSAHRPPIPKHLPPTTYPLSSTFIHLYLPPTTYPFILYPLSFIPYLSIFHLPPTLYPPILIKPCCCCCVCNVLVKILPFNFSPRVL